MIRVVQRKLIIPCGDTGSMTIPVPPGYEASDVAKFFIIDNSTHKIIFSKQCEHDNDLLRIQLTHDETAALPAGNYVWDIKTYKNPVIQDEEIISADEVNSYYAAFSMPRCQIRRTADSIEEINPVTDNSYSVQKTLTELKNKINMLENKINGMISEDNES